LERTVGIAKELGLKEEEIEAAIEVGKKVRAGAASKMDQFATTVNNSTTPSSDAKSEGCAFHRIIKRVSARS
jgi:hypothetical protein